MTEPLTPAVTELLAAIVEALDVPLPGLDEKAERAQHNLMERRVSDVHATLASMLAYPGPIDGREARSLRQRTALNPVTYTVWEQPEPATGGTP
jgi:hypothetical protein